jgi:hypothetical protein
LAGITPQRPRFDPVRAAVRLAFSITVCRLVPASNVNWLAPRSGYLRGLEHTMVG